MGATPTRPSVRWWTGCAGSGAISRSRSDCERRQLRPPAGRQAHPGGQAGARWPRHRRQGGGPRPARCRRGGCLHERHASRGHHRRGRPGAPVSGPLAGLRVLEVGHMLAGPYCGMLLADLGAEVIKIETDDGDIARRLGQHLAGEHSVYFASLNRSKLSVTLDLADAAGRDAFQRLVASAHGLITNLRPRAIRKLGLTYDDLKACNPKLVCVALTGYGLDGPYAERPAYDYVIQAMTGIMEMTGEPGSAPTKAGD